MAEQDGDELSKSVLSLQRIMVTLMSDKPCSFSNEPLSCIVTKIVYGKPVNEICDWDDRVKAIRWVDADSVAGRCETGFSILCSTGCCCYCV